MAWLLTIKCCWKLLLRQHNKQGLFNIYLITVKWLKDLKENVNKLLVVIFDIWLISCLNMRLRCATIFFKFMINLWHWSINFKHNYKNIFTLNLETISKTSFFKIKRIFFSQLNKYHILMKARRRTEIHILWILEGKWTNWNVVVHC